MNTDTLTIADERPAFGSIRCYWRPIIFASATALIICTFWFWSRYPALFSKAAHIGKAVPSMTYTSEVIPVVASAPVWWRIVASSVNWLNGMKVGMTFGVLFGARACWLKQCVAQKLSCNPAARPFLQIDRS